MPKLINAVPKYRKHKASGQAIITLCGRDFYLGPHGSKTSNALVIPGGIGALSLTGTGIAGLSLALSGDGTDLLLTGGVGVPGDFDGDLDVDGDDFLFWQRNVGDAPNLALWQANYGTGGLAAGVQAVPEPSSVVLLAGFAGLAGVARRRGHVAKSQFR